MLSLLKWDCVNDAGKYSEDKTMRDKLKHIGKAVCVLAVISLALTAPNKARAQQCCVCVFAEHIVTRIYIGEQHELTRDHISLELISHREWMVGEFFTLHILRALMMMTDQLTAVAMQQVQMIGAFLDAKHQLETQRLFQELQAEAHKDYHPSEQMCMVGTNVRAMAASERRSEFVVRAMAEHSLSRQMLSARRSSAIGWAGDRADRLQQYIDTYCDFDDNNSGNDVLCQGGGGEPGRVNKDINYTRTVDDELTLNISFSNGGLSDDEEDVLALQNYLFSHDVIPTIQESYLDVQSNRERWLDVRSVVAKRSVLVNAYNYQVGLRAMGTGGNDAFLRRILSELGANSTEINRLGQNVSYYGQLWVLVKALQNPHFFTKLYDTPANVARMGVALQALGLQLDYQMLQSNWRLEMIMAIDAELALMDVQESVENDLGLVRGEGQAM
jgi:hypothetical protein